MPRTGLYTGQKISTHTPLARCDPNRCHTGRGTSRFLLTHLLRGVTDGTVVTWGDIAISTHTPLARCDPNLEQQRKHTRDFYSHTSCEV